ncbi:MAG: hypothetical protein QOC92_991 [Acidimicrobiaceae bacterium]
MDDPFERFARAVFERAGIEVSDDDIALLSMVQAGYDANSAALEQADTVRFPFEPIDPSRAPNQ